MNDAADIVASVRLQSEVYFDPLLNELANLAPSRSRCSAESANRKHVNLCRISIREMFLCQEQYGVGLLENKKKRREVFAAFLFIKVCIHFIFETIDAYS